MNEMHQVTPETNNCTRKEEQYKRLQQPGTLPKARKGSHYDKAKVKLRITPDSQGGTTEARRVTRKISKVKQDSGTMLG